MTKKIFKGIFFSCIVTMLACLVMIMGVLYDHFSSRLMDDLRGKTELVAMSMNSQGTGYLTSLGDMSERVTHIDSDGTVLYDSEIDIKSAENHSTREEVIEALKDGVGESVRDSDTVGKKTAYYAILLKDGTIIRLAMTQSSAWLLMLGIISPIVFIFIVVNILSFVLSTTLAKRIVHPINQIDPDHPEQYSGYDELAPLLRKITAQNRRIAREKEKLSKSREEFHLITENMSEGLLIINTKADILSCNSAAAGLLSNFDGDVVGKSIFVLNRSKEFMQAISLALSGKNNELVLNLKEKVYQIILSPVISDSLVTGSLIFVLDITENAQREQLRREFTSNVSHELKTPLTSIYGISDMLASGMVKSADVKGFAEDINREAGRLIHLVEDIIRLSRLDEGGFSDEKQEVDLETIAHSIIKSLTPAAESAQVKLQLNSRPCKVFGHPTILNEMIYNLCDNAIKYNRRDGYVTLDISSTEDEVIIRVSDSGIGIPSAELDRVFERFYRVDKSHSGKISGTGLGLSIVKHGAAYHGGKIDLQSTEGEGTTVTITLPLKQI